MNLTHLSKSACNIFLVNGRDGGVIQYLRRTAGVFSVHMNKQLP